MDQAWYDKESLRDSAFGRIPEIADAIGVPMSGRFCQCVSGLHDETQYNHCEMCDEGVHCYSCGANYDVFGFVLSFYKNVLGQPISFGMACRIIGDVLGGADTFAVNGQTVVSPQIEEPAFFANLETLRLEGERIHLRRLWCTDSEECLKYVNNRLQNDEKKIQEFIEGLGHDECDAWFGTLLRERKAELQIIKKKIISAKKKTPTGHD